MELIDILKEVGEEKAKIITDAIEAEKVRGISESRKKGEEIKRHLTAANAMRDRIKALGINPDDENVDDQIDALREKVSGKKENSELAKLQREFKALSEKLTAKEQAEADLRKKYANKTLSEFLRKEIGDKVHAPDYVIAGLISEGKATIGDDDSVVFDAKQFLKDNPSIVKNQQNGGGSGGGGDRTKTTEKKVSLDEFNKFSAQERSAYIASGGKVT